MAVFHAFPEFRGISSVLTLFALGFLMYLFVLGVYRLCFSPIAHFPGSRFTAVCGWYETYFEIWRGGQFIFQIEKWHEQYGPIVRINPTEIHISDPEFYDVVYSSNSRFNKMEALSVRFGLPFAVQATAEHDLHHRRRAALNPFFSKRQILDFSPYIQLSAEKLSNRLIDEYRNSSTILSLSEAWGAYTADIITQYAVGWVYDFLDCPHFQAPFTTSSKALADLAHVTPQLPWLSALFQALPEQVLVFLQPVTMPIIELRREIRAQCIKLINGKKTSEGVMPRTVMSELLESNLPPEELSLTRIQQEAFSMIGAGIETTRTALIRACFHIISDRDMYRRLHQELKVAFSDPRKPPTLPELEKLPYLTAVIQESLRLSIGVSSRLPRVSPSSPVLYGKHVIPPGVPFSMSSYLMHHDERIFPSSHRFDPDRWLHSPTAGSSGRPLSRYLVPFSKGTRICLGMNLAYAELYIGLATVFRGLEFELVGTGREAVDMAADYFIPLPKAGTKGVRVLVR